MHLLYSPTARKKNSHKLLLKCPEEQWSQGTIKEISNIKAKAGPMENAPARVLFEVRQGEGGSAEFLSNPEFLFSHIGLCIKCGLTE